MKGEMLNCIESFPSKKILVVGDLIADRYINCSTSRISREAPVLILDYDNEKIIPGGAANAVNNLAVLGSDVVVCGITGRDFSSRQLLEVFRTAFVDVSGLYKSRERSTIVKTRILSGGLNTTLQQIVRIDVGKPFFMSEIEEKTILSFLDLHIKDCDAVLVSDYGYGMLNENTKKIISQKTAKHSIPLVVDSRYSLCSFMGVTLFTPNEEEAGDAVGFRIDSDKKLFKAGEILLERTDCKAILITRGSKGMALFERGCVPYLISVCGGDEIADVTGAGDTVASVACLAVSCGCSLKTACRMANIAGGNVVMKRGTATISIEELKKGVAEYEIN
jgi:rfaE bifunctional protein kinase chain/domain